MAWSLKRWMMPWPNTALPGARCCWTRTRTAILTPVVAHGDDGVSASAAGGGAGGGDRFLHCSGCRRGGEGGEESRRGQCHGGGPANRQRALRGGAVRHRFDCTHCRGRGRTLGESFGFRRTVPRMIRSFRCSARSTRSSYGLITSAGRLVLAHVVELPKVSLEGPLSVTGGVRAEELLGMTENTDPVRGERVIAAIAMPSPEDGQPTPLALGTRNGVVKRWNRESPTTMDSWSVIDLKDGDAVLAAAEARDDDRLVFVSTDSSSVDIRSEECASARPNRRRYGWHPAGGRLLSGRVRRHSGR